MGVGYAGDREPQFSYSPDEIPDRGAAEKPVAGGIFQDNIPMGVAVPHIPEVMEKQNGVCTVDQWRDGQCSFTPIVIDIQFSQLGDFVYHCHILSHEDAGMMAKIRVVPSPN
jgi:L-ascorbate oxidase